VNRQAVVFLSALTLLAVACAEKEKPVAAPPEVYVADVTQKDVPVYLEIVGQTRGSQDVEIRARVEGYLDAVKFTEGAFVTKGTPLYQIDPKPLEAAIANAKANLATAKARLDKTNNDVARYRPLAEQQAVSRQELDNAVSAQEAAQAQMAAGQAAVDKAALDLGYTSIASPLDGVVGTTNVKAGNLVGRGESTLLTTVSQVNPILFRAGISEAEYLRIAKRVQATGQRATGRRNGASEQGARRSDRACGRSHHRHARCAVHVPEPKPRGAPRAVWPRAVHDREQAGRAPGSAAGGDRTAEPVQRRRRRLRQQG
jgi:membrane fusion protein (multidrug efflux system)